jgi:competence protein ComEC
LLGFYGALGLLAAVPQIRPPRRWCLALLAAWTTVGFAAAAWRHDNERLDCTFLSMGHGCAVVVELPSGQTLLYDAGQFGSPGGGSRSIAEFLWSRGITHLDAIVLSHGDLDHYNAMPGLLQRFSVGVIYVSPFMFENRNPALDALAEVIERRGVPTREVIGGDVLPGGEDCRIEVLHPPRRGMLGEDNANSIVLSVEYRGRRILLPGDLDSPGMEAVLAEEPLDCDVLQAPHHGSRRSNPPGLAAWCTPEWVVVSGGRRWDPAPIRQTYAAAGAEVLHTAEWGAVRVRITPSGIRVDPHLP